MKSKPVPRFVLIALAGVCLAAAACGAGAIDEAELETTVAAQLGEEAGQPPPDIDCPGDLDAEVGATMECDLSVEGDSAVYPVTVKVTSVEDGKANYSVEVGESPSSGGSEATTEEEPAEGDAPADESEAPVEEQGDPPAEEVDPGAEGAE